MTIVHLTNGDGHHGEPEPVISTDVLIIGTGPAGASLAGFLAMHGECVKSHAVPLKKD